MTLCFIVETLATVAVILVLLPWLLWRLQLSGRLKLLSQYCNRLCRVWILLAFLGGVVIGGLLLTCWDELRRVIAADHCSLLVVAALLLLIWALHQYMLVVARCGFVELPTFPNPFARQKRAARGIHLRLSPYVLIAILVLLAWVLVRRCCGGWIGSPDFDWSICTRLVIAAAIVFLLYVTARFLVIRLCDLKDPTKNDCLRAVARAVLVVIIAALSVLIAVWRCCDRLSASDVDLALSGIWWEGARGEEEGAHLRISFRVASENEPGLAFPEGGFDLERREAGGGTWQVITSRPLHPVSEWGDEAIGPAGDMALAIAIERLHTDDWDRFRGTRFDELLELLARAPYDTLFYAAEPHASLSVSPPANPYFDRASRSAYLDSYYAAAPPGTNYPPLMVWNLVPLPILMTTATHAEMARLLGLLYVDGTADPGVAYDYRVTGYWPDRTRRYTLEGVSRASTEELEAPQLETPATPVVVASIGTEVIHDDRAASLRWSPPVGDPPVVGGVDDMSIEPVLFYLQHQLAFENSRFTRTYDCVPDSATGQWSAPLLDRANATQGSPADTTEPVLLSPIWNAITDEYEWPRHFFVHRNLEYGCHAYRVFGRDIFGRFTDYSAVKVTRTRDLTPPAPPSFVNVNIFQRGDPNLDDAIRANFFPAGSTHEVQFWLTWLWPPEQATAAPDLTGFFLYVGLSDFDPFPGDAPSLADSPWMASTYWIEQELLGPIPAAAAQALPQSLVDLGYSVETLFFERTFTDEDLAAAGVTLVSLGLDAGDTAPVRTAYFGVAAYDNAGNKGAVSTPVIGLVKDVTPPDPPPPPELTSGPLETDRSGRRGLQLSWVGTPLHTYFAYRVNVADLSVDPAAGGGDVVPCVSAQPPAQPAGMNDADYADLVRRYRIRATITESRVALAAAGKLGRITGLPIDVSAGRAALNDRVDGRVSGEYVYCAVAIDSAGNQSGLSCPSDVVLVEDGVAPRAPVVTAAIGGQEHVAITWAANTEPDLARYHVYRAVAPGDTTSRRRMRWIASLDESGADVAGGPLYGQPDPESMDGTQSGAGEYTRWTWQDTAAAPGRMYHYRLAAADIAGNQSALSQPFAAAAIDTVAPEKPTWTAAPVSVAPAEHGLPAVTLVWHRAGAEDGLQYILKRREADGWTWWTVGSWTPAGDTLVTHSKGLVFEKSYYYRVRAMDQVGNRGEWSDSLLVDVEVTP